MKVAFERRAQDQLAKRALVTERVEAKKEYTNLRIRGAKSQKLNEMRFKYALCRIQGLIRGYLARLKFKELLILWRAAIVIQRVMRGKLGRIRWMKLYWLKTSVVKSDTALRDLLARSTLVRRNTVKGMNGWDWQERFDPLTNSVFYYNKHNGRNTWDCPVIFQKHLVCTWDGLTGFRAATNVEVMQFNPNKGQGAVNGGSSAASAGGGDDESSVNSFGSRSVLSDPLAKAKEQLKKPKFMSMLVTDKVTGKRKRIKFRVPDEEKDPNQACRCVFRTVEELHQHMKRAHRWYCPACEECNTGLSFPICGLCGNTLSESGFDGLETIKENMKKIHDRLDQFLKFEKVKQGDEAYSLRKRLVELTKQRRSKYEAFMKENPPVDEDVEWMADIEAAAAAAAEEAAAALARAGPQELLPTHIDPALDPHGMLGRYEEVLRSLYYNRAFGPVWDGDHGGPAAALDAAGSVAMSSIASGGGLADDDADEPGIHKRRIALPLMPRNSSQILMSKHAPLPVNGTHGVTALAAIAELGYGKLGENPSPTQNRRAQRAAAAAAALATSAPPSALTQKKGLKLIRYAYEGTILGRSYQRKPRPPPPPPPPENMRPVPPALDTSYSGTVWEVPTKTPALYHKYFPQTTFFGVKQNVRWGKVHEEEEVEDEEDEEAAAAAAAAAARAALPAAPPPEDTAVFPYDVDGRGKSKTVTKIVEARKFKERGGTRAERHPIASSIDVGILFHDELHAVLDGVEDAAADEERMRMERYLRNHPEGSDGGPGGPKFNRWGTLNTSWVDSTDTLRLLVCPEYMHGACTLTTCPLAHPGVRDDAMITYSKPPGEKKKLPLVRVCKDHDAFHQECEAGKLCRRYHVYVRPSTRDIIKRMYPLQSGVRMREFRSGAKLEGNYKDENFNGYGVMVWPDKSTYIGDWKDGLRHGMGIVRSASGLEYVGGWVAGRRHGLGVATTANGDQYMGEWVDGHMEGVGRLHCCNGDIYEGQFHRSRYHGLGTFYKYGGDTYMGHLVEGKASGLGVLALNSGEKYKGYFDLNFKHGRGVATYRNGSRYAGGWYRGHHDGFGVYLSPEGDKYIGEWAAGKKHGKGRYYFAAGDFYDGDFVKNRAEGQGVYFHANGNIYTGQWENDKRNGRGTYVFINGSKFTGNFVDNDIHGKGKFDFACGSHYRGEFKHNQKHGRGIFTWPNLAEYKGQFCEDRIEGHGEIRYASGHHYIGMWKNNKKNGYGTFTYRRGHVYEGYFRDDIRHGKGKMTFFPMSSLQESYDGDWDNDVIHGVGTYTYRVDEGRVVYHGDWDRGIRHGKGLLTYGDGSFYRGDFFLEQMHGRGVYVFKGDGAQYDGQWKNNMRHGMGSSIEPDGTIYHGEYHCNMRQGRGCLEDCDGGVFTGDFESNVKVGKGVFTLPVGVGPVGGPTVIKIKCFAL